jgi:nucleoid DNA-binding protein
MTKTELIKHFMKKTGLSKRECKEYVDIFITHMFTALEKGGDIAFNSFGRLYLRQLKSRTGISPVDRSLIRFKPSKKLRARLPQENT